MNELGTVVVVSDADLHPSLQSAAGAEGDRFIACSTAQRGLNTCCALEPSCVVVAHHPPDVDAAWLVSSIRAQPTSVAAVPILVLLDDTAKAAEEHAFASGADMVLPRSTEPRALIRQVDALVALATRIRERGVSIPFLEPEPKPKPKVDVAERAADLAIGGSLERTNVATILAVLELQRASGELWLARGPHSQQCLVVELASGAVAGGRLDEVRLEPREAIDAAVHWGPGLFDFLQGPARVSPSNAKTLTALLLATLSTSADDAEGPAPTTRVAPLVDGPPISNKPSSRRSSPRIKAVTPAPAPANVRIPPAPKRTLQSQPAVTAPAAPAPAGVQIPPAPKRTLQSQPAVTAPAAPAPRPPPPRPPPPRPLSRVEDSAPPKPPERAAKYVGPASRRGAQGPASAKPLPREEPNEVPTPRGSR